MRNIFRTTAVIVIMATIIPGVKGDVFDKMNKVKLPEPVYESNMSVEEAIKERRSIRRYGKNSLKLSDVAQLLWAAQGITGKGRFRSAPSAGATYPLEIYLVAGNVTRLKPGIYRYLPQVNALEPVIKGDKRDGLSAAALNQKMVKNAQINIVITAVYKRTTGTYGERGARYAHMEAGHVGQNIYLQAETLGLGTVAIGAFDDASVVNVLELDKEEEPLYIFPVGKKWVPYK